MYVYVYIIYIYIYKIIYRLFKYYVHKIVFLVFLLAYLLVCFEAGIPYVTFLAVLELTL